jgi:hypothetical protein
MPPSTTAKTMRRETPIPASVSGLTYEMYCDAADGGQHRGEHGDADLEAAHVNADGGGRRLVLADRLHRGARHRAVDAPPDIQAHQPQRERAIVEDALVGELDGQQAVSPGRLHGHAE